MKKVFYIITLLLVVNLIFLIFLITYKNKEVKDNEQQNQMITTPGEDLSFELNNKIFPENYLEFERLTKNAKIDKDEIYKSLYNFVKSASNTHSDTSKMSSQELKQYYENNKNEVINKTGISTQEDFLKTVSLLKKVYTGNDVYYRNVKIVTETFNGDNGINCEFNIEFNNNKTIKLKLIIDSYNSETFKFVPIVEE